MIRAIRVKELVNWLEVSLLVEGEAAEAVADALARFAPEGGVVIESTSIQAVAEMEGQEEGRPAGPLRVRCYLPADGQLEDTRRRLEEALWHLGRILPLPEPTYRPVAEADWAEAWKASYHPVRLGKRLVIVPAWLDPPLLPEEIPIRLEPGMAFGTGTHPTTQLCLTVLEDLLQPGQAVLDLGCGSGILAIAAARLGASWVLAVDIDPGAVRIARENALANGVQDRVRVEQGSLFEVLEGRFGPPGSDLVLANILARAITQFAEQGLADAMAPEGKLVVSGILAEQVIEVEGALRTGGLTVTQQRRIEDWVALVALSE